ncbi:MAG: hypothetical protein IJ916_04760 [Paludibacteraceae bacterium]|nr:hypothetical protein [Paludibacteraceae bacterium]
MEKKEIIQISATTTVIIILLILLFSNKSLLSFRQIGDYINQGNEFFDEKKYDDAKIKYVGALQIDSTNSGALYNNANADYRNGRYEMADKTYANAVRSTLKSDASEDSKELVSSIYKNKGNANMKRLTPLDSILMTNDLITKMEAAGQNVNEIKQQFYNNLQENLKIIQTPIKDYKESLRNAPENDSTRFNLAMAQDYEKKVAQILQSMTPPSNGQNNQNNNQKDQNQDQQQQQQQDQQQQQQQQQEEQQSKDQMSKENAEQILNALEQEEKDQQKKRKIEQKDSRYKTDKDW